MARTPGRLTAICQDAGVRILYSFGSRGKEVEEYIRETTACMEAGPRDCDLGAKLRAGHGMDVQGKVDLSRSLEDLLGVSRVDLVLLDEADPFLACNIIRGERLYCDDPHYADEYELYLLRRAGDLAPLERERQVLILGSE